MQQSNYDLLAAEYYDDTHKTCRNFDFTTQAALANNSVSVPEHGLVLEVGCGRGRCTEFLGIPSSRIVQLDSSRTMLAIQDREACCLKVHADATSIPLFDNQFTAVVGFLIDPFIGLGFFSEAYRLLVADGRFLATTPATEWGHSLRGDKEPDASSARFVTRTKETVVVPSALVPSDKIAAMLTHCGFQHISITSHCLPRQTNIISPDVQNAAERRGVDLYELPLIYLIEAIRP